jgi:hypothetical protein
MSSTTIQYFNYDRSCPAIQQESLDSILEPIYHLAHRMEDLLPDSPEKSAGMRKLLEAHDCFLRAALA